MIRDGGGDMYDGGNKVREAQYLEAFLAIQLFFIARNFTSAAANDSLQTSTNKITMNKMLFLNKR